MIDPYIHKEKRQISGDDHASPVHMCNPKTQPILHAMLVVAMQAMHVYISK